MGCSLCTIRASTKTTSKLLSLFKSLYSAACVTNYVTIVEMLQEVTNDVRIEPILQALTGEEQSVSGNV